MDVSVLHTLTEDLAAFLSEVTLGDLTCAVPCTAGDVGDLYLCLVDRSLTVATAITGDEITPGQWNGPTGRAALAASADGCHGGAGLEVGYRRAARLMENAFAAATATSRLARPQAPSAEADVAFLYEEQISSTVLHTWDIAQALDLPYRPAPDITQRMLRNAVLLRTTQPESSTGTWSTEIDNARAFDCMLTLSHRTNRSRTGTDAHSAHPEGARRG